MAQQFDFPETETQLREIQDKLYQHSKEVYGAGGRPAFKGLLEIMSAEATITTAIHNIKSNHGSETPGVDGKRMRHDYLKKSHQWVIRDIQKAFQHFEAQKIRRKYIDKPGKAEKRPLGIPTIRDRIVQECMRIVLEPILEAQFFPHSYGFRPMRDAAMALEHIDILMHNKGHYWVVEGDISKCFDRIDHNSLRNRVKLGLCELCGKRTGNIALHQVKRMKDLKGRTDWERLMLERRRKTLAVCPECHEKIHFKTISAGNKINGEPYTSRGVCTVREGVRR